LTALFAFRVVAQVIQAWHPIAFLPAFDRWHSGTFPYAWLVGLQILILALCVRIVWQLLHNRVMPSLRKGHVLITLGIIYFVGMGIRLGLGVTVSSEHEWFGATLPTLFHLVLASFVMLYGRFHCLASQRASAIPQGHST
jgi:hypothetical protein